MVFNGGIGKEAQMSGRDFLLVASTAAISSLLTYLAVTRLTTTPVAPRVESRAASHNPVAASDKPGGTAAPVETDKPDAPKIGGESHSGHTPAQDPAAAMQRQREFGERFSRLHENGSTPDPGVINAKIEDRFYLEEWNQEWAGSKESSIRTLFKANEVLSGITPMQVTCRSKNCQVVLPASTQDQVRVLSAKFMQAATRGDVGMKDQVVSYFPDVSTGRLVFYLSDDGNTDLFQ